MNKYEYILSDPDITSDEIERIRKKDKRTRELLNSWKQGNTLQNLLIHLHKIGRWDIISDLKETLHFQWKHVSHISIFT